MRFRRIFVKYSAAKTNGCGKGLEGVFILGVVLAFFLKALKITCRRGSSILWRGGMVRFDTYAQGTVAMHEDTREIVSLVYFTKRRSARCFVRENGSLDS